ncbi:MAG TPA: PRC-barrel domain-containing protein [Rhodopila sp.]|nr:PRC-barrel domain-containing protein [Rhodopila sp.]
MQRLAWIFVFLVMAAAPSWADEASPAGSGADKVPPGGGGTSPPGSAETAPPSAGEKPPTSAVHKVLPEEAEAVLGQRVLDPNGKTIGRLIDVLVNAAGEPQAAVIDFGGFMGVGTRKIAVHWSALQFNPSDPEHKVVLEMTPDQIKAAPEYRHPDQPAPVVVPAPPPPSPPPSPAPSAAQAHDTAPGH